MYDRQCREVILRYWKKKGLKDQADWIFSIAYCALNVGEFYSLPCLKAGTFLSCIFVRCNFCVAYFSIFLDLSVFSDIQL